MDGGRGYWKRHLGGREGVIRRGVMRQFYWNTKIKDRPPGRRSLRFQKVKTLPGKLLNNGFINITNPNKNNLNDY